MTFFDNLSNNKIIFIWIDFSSDGIRQIVELTVSSSRARQQLITYISQLQLHTYTQASKTNPLQSNETILLRVSFSFYKK